LDFKQLFIGICLGFGACDLEFIGAPCLLGNLMFVKLRRTLQILIVLVTGDILLLQSL
jgi:hypothetical protein